MDRHRDHDGRHDDHTHPDGQRLGPHGHDDDARYVDRPAGVAAAREQFGGVKIGASFFGWLTATGAALLLTALVAAAGTAVGIASDADLEGAAEDASANPETVGLVGAVVLFLVIFLAYFCGGYVAGRMARFDGARQGLAVWVWTVVIALVVAALAAVAGERYDVLSELNSFPRIPVGGGELTTGGLIALIVVAVASLLGAVAGGVAGMRFHRRVDAAEWAH
jgi:hypothetical protein